MNVLITGGSGFIGQKLLRALLAKGKIEGAQEPIDEIVLFDVGPAPQAARDPRVTFREGDIGDPASVRSALGERTALVFHLAAIVSSNAEEDFDLGYRVNLGGTRNLLEASRRLPSPPRIVFTSSCACYGGDLPDVVPDSWILTPQTSYGAQKAAGELLLQDYTRKGFVDGRTLRLPTIVVRPGKPNKAASTFASSIIREPLAGKPAICPVRPESRMYILSPRRVVESLIRAAELPSESLGAQRSLTLPGIDASIGELVDGLKRAAGQRAAELVEWRLDERIQKIVSGWPASFEAKRARSLGFRSDASVDEIIRAHIEDEGVT